MKVAMPLSEHKNQLKITQVFPAMLLSYQWEDTEEVNRELVKIILAKEQEDPGLHTTNCGGWHSQKNLQTWEAHCIQVLLQRMLFLGHEMLNATFQTDDPQLCTGWHVQAWANINRQGHYNRFHHHLRNNNIWSGVYYVDTGIGDVDHDKKVARIIFSDLHRIEVHQHSIMNSEYSVEPCPGLMLLFPSSLGHHVEVHQGKNPRITVAFNLKHASFTNRKYEMESKERMR